MYTVMLYSCTKQWIDGWIQLKKHKKRCRRHRTESWLGGVWLRKQLWAIAHTMSLTTLISSPATTLPEALCHGTPITSSIPQLSETFRPPTSTAKPYPPPNTPPSLIGASAPTPSTFPIPPSLAQHLPIDHYTSLNSAVKHCHLIPPNRTLYLLLQSIDQHWSLLLMLWRSIQECV